MPQVQVSPFTEMVLKTIHSIPKGKVATYKQVAELSGSPHAVRGVAWILHSMSTKHKLPWQRVINAKGQIAFKPRSHNFREQRKRLEREGVEVSPDGQIDLSEFQWSKKPRKRPPARGKPRMFADKN